MTLGPRAGELGSAAQLKRRQEARYGCKENQQRSDRK